MEVHNRKCERIGERFEMCSKRIKGNRILSVKDSSLPIPFEKYQKKINIIYQVLRHGPRVLLQTDDNIE
jgi:hypothetical protein